VAATAHGIAEKTQQRVLHAAALYGYFANTVARSLRQKRSYTIGSLSGHLKPSRSMRVA
jgi:DNA-binding LacI/PurR family transcriptional regulator